jgi:hydrogenase/urease accessory protein HupE
MLALALALPVSSWGHSPTNAVYSKYEATASGRELAFVFALDKNAVLLLLQRDVTHAPVDPAAIEGYRDFFSQYVFQRFFVSNDGVACTHPDRLGRFFWHAPTGRVLAVTKFSCASDLSRLTIRSLVTHDMPTSHELVGDLQYRRALVRSFFHGDDVEAQIVVSALPQTGEPVGPEARRTRGRFTYVPVPDRARRYDNLAEAELGMTLSSERAVDVHPFRTLAHFIGQGVVHIFTGYDHILFIMTLMLAVGTWRRLAVIVTSFTAAHSLTLVAATLGIVTIPARVVEPLIALSVLLVAVDALARPQANARAAVTFGFGLVHGFGLSNVLRELGLSGRELVPALLGFNVGVEIGQLLIVMPLFPLVLWLRRQSSYARARALLCGAVAVVAVFWIVLRVGAAVSS